MKFIEQIVFLVKNLPSSFWISLAIVSPIFILFEVIIETALTKFLFYIFIKFPKRQKKILAFIGFSNFEKYNELEKLHSQYDNNTIFKKLKISEDFLDETRGAMFAYNELSHIILGKVTTDDSESFTSDNFFFDYDIIYKQDFSIKELEQINEGKILIHKEEGNDLFKIKERFGNNLIRKKVYREKPKVILPKNFIISFKAKMEEAEGHFLENIEMYLFHKKLHFRWIVFKSVVFIPFMIFLSELIEEIISFFDFI